MKGGIDRARAREAREVPVAFDPVNQGVKLGPISQLQNWAQTQTRCEPALWLAWFPGPGWGLSLMPAPP